MIRKSLILALLLGIPASATDVEKKVQFAAGTSEIVLKGTVDTAKKKDRFGPARDRYTLGAAAGQTMTISLVSNRPVLIYIWHKDYNQGFLWHNNSKPVTGKALKLPAADNYVVDVEPAYGVPAATYSVTVGIQ